jgi:hypothetical protein
MRKVTLLLVSVLSCTGFISAGTEPEGLIMTKISDGYLVTLNIREIQQHTISAEGEDYVRFEVESYGSTSQVGKPALPLMSFNLAVPYKTNDISVELISAADQTISLKSKVYPVQEPWVKSRLLSERPFIINKTYYNSTGEETPFISVSESFIIGGVKGFRIIIQPFNYIPSENKVSIVKDAVFKIKVSPGEVYSQRSSFYDKFLQQVFVNYKSSSSDYAVKYLIITPPELEPALSSFRNHKEVLGYSVEIFSTTATGSTPSAIKSFIQQRYNNLVTRPEFILLVGDVDKIPAWTGNGEGNPKTDLYYALLEGTDYYPDVFVGRFSVSDITGLQNAINKTIFMENNIPAVSGKGVFMASKDFYSITEGSHNYVINNYFLPNNYSSIKLYSKTYSATTTQLISALNNNQTFAVYSGHGSSLAWTDGPYLSQVQVQSLNNTVFPFVYSFACLTGDYANTSECFGETWLRTEKGGSSFFGSSVETYWTEDDIFERNIFKIIFEDNITRVTPIADKAKISLINYFGSLTPVVLRYLESYNLIGDPSLETAGLIIPDQTAPSAVADLFLFNPTSNSLTLNWTVPYDSSPGGVVMYDVRYSTEYINEADFINADQELFSAYDTAGTLKEYSLDKLKPSQEYYIALKAIDRYGNSSPVSNIASAFTLAAPVIAVSPSSLMLRMDSDSSKVESILISNVSPSSSTLNYTIDLLNNTYPGRLNALLVPVINTEFNKKNADELKTFPGETGGMSFKGGGGPDAFGYTWKDNSSSDGPKYFWDDISLTGTPVSNWVNTGTVSPLDDGYAGPVPIGFNFNFYGEQKSGLYIHTNGLILFDIPKGNWTTNYNIPNSADPNAFIAPFWDDLDGQYGGTVHYKQIEDKFLIQYTNWKKYNSSSYFTFQVVLNKSGKITYYYKNLSGDRSSCTVGIEGPKGTTGLPVVYNASYLNSGRAVEFTPYPEWLFTNCFAGTIHSGNSTALQLKISSDRLCYGEYSMDVQISSNCELNPSVTVPVKLTVSDDIPVELASFNVLLNKGEVILEWETKSEKNNNGFQIERKANENIWQELAFVKGSGTTTESHKYIFSDKPNTAGSYKYRLLQYDYDGTKTLTDELDVEIKGPEMFELSQNYPNPFNPVTTIKYSLPVQSRTAVTIHNIVGELMENISEIREPGYYEFQWNASGFSSGVYICTLNAAAIEGQQLYRSVKKMILMK